MAESKTAIMAALLGNGALAVLKGVAAASTGSAAMLAETLHSIADTGNQALLFLGMRVSKYPPDRRHLFGYGKAVYFWAFVVSVMLFSLGGAFSIWEGVRKLLHGGEHEGAVGWAYAVLGGGFVFEVISLGIALRALDKAKGGKTLRAYWRDNRDPTLPTVVLEDTAALISLAIAAAGIWLTQTTASPVWDALASGLIGLMLVGVAIVLALENYSLLIGEAAPEGVEATIRRLVSGDDDVVEVVDLRTMHIGPHDILVALGIQFRPDLTTLRIQAAITRLQQAIRKALGESTNPGLIIIEPAAPDGDAFGKSTSPRSRAVR
ncbi:MAG: cation diffusion facilitator family transporter [Candidatus Rokuibacteriota bacterium]